MRLLVSGAREWGSYHTDETIMHDALFLFDRIAQIEKTKITLVEGCQRGADQMAERLAQMIFGWEVDHHEAQWDKYGVGAGPIRNQEMLASGVDQVLAFHRHLKKSDGTLDMVERCLRKGVPLLLYPAS